MFYLSVDEILLPTYVNCLPFNEAIAPPKLKNKLFSMSSHRNQCILLFTPGDATEIWLKQVHLQEVLDHQYSLHQ